MKDERIVDIKRRNTLGTRKDRFTKRIQNPRSVIECVGGGSAQDCKAALANQKLFQSTAGPDNHNTMKILLLGNANILTFSFWLAQLLIMIMPTSKHISFSQPDNRILLKEPSQLIQSTYSINFKPTASEKLLVVSSSASVEQPTPPVVFVKQSTFFVTGVSKDIRRLP